MKTKHSPGENDPILSFCKATNESRELAFFFLEGFSWDLDNAVSGFLQGRLPPIKEPQLQRSPSRYTTTSALKSSSKMDDADEVSKTLDDRREPIRLPMAFRADPVKCEPEEEGSAPSCKDV
ncbi:plant UBX domain-containing protein 5 [Eutrema salsugineum]|uniref:plant UBX domain-containing protein 5 n=1 Tax=Eutrema salsugineum TaxID=72664 RepID=UPI000CECE9D1|nr:plant UBX domain-containing protein 5 [Eutrema salsugineum]